MTRQVGIPFWTDRWLRWAIAVGFLLRVAVWAVSIGSNDPLMFLHTGRAIQQHGLFGAYRVDPDFVQPPISGWWTWLAFRLAGNSTYRFALIFRIPTIFADAGCVWILARMSRPRHGFRPLAMAALFACCPAAILISAYHGNFDSICAFLSLLAVFLLEKDRPLGAGLALAAAVNIKLIPVLLVVPLLLDIRKWPAAGRFSAGLTVGIIPFLFPLIGDRQAFLHHVIGYRSWFNLWGVNFFLAGFADSMQRLPRSTLIYHNLGRYLLIAMVLVWSIIARVVRRFNRYDIAAATYALFLIFASGFGLQYLVAPLPLLFAGRPRMGTAYGLCAGAFALSAYELAWDGHFPIESLFHGLFPARVAWIGLIAWLELVCYLALLWQPTEPAAPAITHD